MSMLILFMLSIQLNENNLLENYGGSHNHVGPIMAMYARAEADLQASLTSRKPMI